MEGGGGVKRQQLSQIADISLGYIIRRVAPPPIRILTKFALAPFPKGKNQQISVELNFKPQCKEAFTELTACRNQSRRCFFSKIFTIIVIWLEICSKEWR